MTRCPVLPLLPQRRRSFQADFDGSLGTSSVRDVDTRSHGRQCNLHGASGWGGVGAEKQVETGRVHVKINRPELIVILELCGVPRTGRRMYPVRQQELLHRLSRHLCETDGLSDEHEDHRVGWTTSSIL